jgi:hypothetical protein
MDGRPVARCGSHQQPSFGRGWHSPGRGNGPQQGTPCAGNGDHALMGMVACGHPVALPCAAPDLGLPADGLDRCGELCQASWEMPPAWGRIAVGPRTFDQGTPGRGMPGLGNAPLLPPPPLAYAEGVSPRACMRGRGARRASGRPVRPPSSPPPCPGPRARPGGPRRQERSARGAPARGVRVLDGPAVPAVQ